MLPGSVETCGLKFRKAPVNQFWGPYTYVHIYIHMCVCVFRYTSIRVHNLFMFIHMYVYVDTYMSVCMVSWYSGKAMLSPRVLETYPEWTPSVTCYKVVEHAGGVR